VRERKKDARAIMLGTELTVQAKSEAVSRKRFPRLHEISQEEFYYSLEEGRKDAKLHY